MVEILYLTIFNVSITKYAGRLRTDQFVILTKQLNDAYDSLYELLIEDLKIRLTNTSKKKVTITT